MDCQQLAVALECDRLDSVGDMLEPLLGEHGDGGLPVRDEPGHVVLAEQFGQPTLGVGPRTSYGLADPVPSPSPEGDLP